MNRNLSRKSRTVISFINCDVDTCENLKLPPLYYRSVEDEDEEELRIDDESPVEEEIKLPPRLKLVLKQMNKIETKFDQITFTTSVSTPIVSREEMVSRNFQNFKYRTA